MSAVIGSGAVKAIGSIDERAGPGLGFEGQLRLDRGLWSSGIGMDYQRHATPFVTYFGPSPTAITTAAPANFLGAFFELRRHTGPSTNRWRPHLTANAGPCLSVKQAASSRSTAQSRQE